jgi:hypothetical protein
MMQTAQNRQAQQAASQRQQSYNDTIAQQVQSSATPRPLRLTPPKAQRTKPRSAE